MQTENASSEKALKVLSPFRISIAIFLGVSISGFLLYNKIKDNDIKDLLQAISNPNWYWFSLIFLVLIIRDLGYAYRIKNITSNQLSWRSSINTILTWEFASAATPSVVGGTAVAVFILRREGIKLGKSMAYVMFTAILDNLYFILAATIVFLTYSENILSGFENNESKYTIETVFFISYGLITGYTGFMITSLFIAPKIIRSLIYRAVFILKIKKWKTKLISFGSELHKSSKELKTKSLGYYLKAIFATFFVWTARYFLLNCMLAAFLPEMTFDMHIEAFSKQVVLWITMLVSPTPGGAGFALYFLQKLFGTSLLIISIGIFWRIVTFYAYLIIGSIVTPRWLRNTYKRNQQS